MSYMNTPLQENRRMTKIQGVSNLAETRGEKGAGPRHVTDGKRRNIGTSRRYTRGSSGFES